MELLHVADELYALAPQQFTAARDAAAREAREGGDKDLSAAISKLRRPSAGAALVNLLARHRAADLDELLDLGESLRAAQDALAGDELRTLSRQRHQAVHALADQARDLAGQPVTATVSREVETTLDAALGDPDAADAVRTGRLVRGLTSAGFDAIDLAGAVAAPDPGAATRPRAAARTKPAKRSPAKAAPPREKVTAARRAVRDARVELDRVDRDLARQDDSVTAARAAVDQARDRVGDLERDLERARAQRADAEHAADAAQRERTTLARAQRAAQRTLGKAEDALRALDG